MNLNKILFGAGALLLSLSGAAWSDDAPAKGPCHKAWTSITIPGNCEPDCNFICWDPSEPVTLNPGGCQGLGGNCSTTIIRYPGNVYRDCDCPFLGGICEDAGVKNGGLVTGLSCSTPWDTPDII